MDVLKRQEVGKSAHRLLSALVVIAFLLAYGYLTYTYASGIEDYISDECWYVSAARNTIIKYLGVNPDRAQHGMTIVTVELYNPLSEYEYLKIVSRVKGFIENDLGGRIIKGEEYYKFSSDGKFLPALCVEVNQSLIASLLSYSGVKQVIRGYCYPNAEGVFSYMNLEHPPLVKYFIGLSMVLLGDYPAFWRVPSIIAGTLILLFIFLLFREVVKKDTWLVLGLATALITAFDKTFRSMSMVAMLDIFVALFTMLTLYSVLTNRLGLTSIFVGLGFASKFSGAFPAVPAVLYWIKREKPAKVFLLIVYTPILLLLLLGIPYIVRDGFLQWWNASVEGAFRWHLSVKTTEGPPQAMPWDWLLGRNPFPLHYVWDAGSGQFIADLIASGNPVLYTLTAALSLIILPSLRDLPDKGVSHVFTWLTYLMYVAMWFLGGRTQYSFYAVQVVPLFYTTLVMIVYYLTASPANIRELVKRWRRILNVISMWLAGEVSVSMRLVISDE